jgi:hypothetical protein
LLLLLLFVIITRICYYYYYLLLLLLFVIITTICYYYYLLLLLLFVIITTICYYYYVVLWNVSHLFELPTCGPGLPIAGAYSPRSTRTRPGASLWTSASSFTRHQSAPKRSTRKLKGDVCVGLVSKLGWAGFARFRRIEADRGRRLFWGSSLRCNETRGCAT